MTKELVKWPQSSDSLFNYGPDWENEALLGQSEDWSLTYAISYKNTADFIVERIEAKQASPESVGYAVCYLYRHYVELMLKGLINLGTQLDSTSASNNKGHRIDDLWRKCRPLLEKAFPEGEQADNDAVERCIVELAKIDPTGEAFRYGEYTNGRPTIPRLQISLTNMRDVMNRIAGFLEGSYDGMDELLQNQTDIDSTLEA